MNVVIKSVSCEQKLEKWKKETGSFATTYIIMPFFGALIAMPLCMYIVMDCDSIKDLMSGTNGLITLLAILALFAVFLLPISGLPGQQLKKISKLVKNSERYSDLCGRENLMVTDTELLGNTENGSIQVPLNAIQSVEIKYAPSNSNQKGPTEFNNDALVIHCADGIYYFWSFSNCGEIKNVLEHMR